MILPLKTAELPTDVSWWQLFAGGIVDENLNHVGGFQSNPKELMSHISIVTGYAVEEEVEYCDYDVVFCGIAFHHFGHFLTDAMSNWWYIAEKNRGG
jgi:hypothetical protein